MTSQSTNINDLLEQQKTDTKNDLVQEIIKEIKEQQKQETQHQTQQQQEFATPMDSMPRSIQQTKLNHHPFMKTEEKTTSSMKIPQSLNVSFIKEIAFVVLLNYFLNTSSFNNLLLKIPQFVSSDNLNIPNFIGILIKALVSGILFLILKLSF